LVNLIDSFGLNSTNSNGPGADRMLPHVARGHMARITIAADPKRFGARIGITAVLHTWGSAMTQNPHSWCLASSIIHALAL
jgi:hypothetical protein